MATPNSPKQSLKTLLVEKVPQIPGISHKPWPERDDGFATLHFCGKEISHFHNFREIDLRPGRKLIKKEVEGIVRLIQIAVEAP